MKLIHAASAVALTLLCATDVYAQTPPSTTAGMSAGQSMPGGMDVAAAFKKRDANHDGFLSKTEIAGSRLADAFAQLDTNKDGKLSLAEYTKGRESLRGQRQEKRAEQDTGMGAGPQTQNGQPLMRNQTAEQRFQERDKNNDGFLTKAELAGSRLANRFDQMDTNHDGKLSLNELKAGMQNRDGQGPGTNRPGMGTPPTPADNKTRT